MQQSITVAVDAMGGDNAPAVEVAGAVEAARNWSIPIILVGDQQRLQEELAKHSIEGLNIRIQHAAEVVGMKDSPSDAVRKKPGSSIRQAFQLVKDGSASAVVSAGNSGATMALGMFLLKRIDGIERPAIATVVPNLKGHTLVLDVGGNVDCKPQHLAQFALMGKVYAETIMGKEGPVIGLLSNGEEESKGNEQTRLAHGLLQNCLDRYAGYVEGRDIYNGRADVVVCDGFVGNIVLKASEGLAETIGSILRQEIENNLLAKLGYLLSGPAFRKFRKRIDYAEVGGAPLLGIRGTGMICHGGSNSKAVMNAICQARDSVAKGVIEQLNAQVQSVTPTMAAPVDDGQQALN